MVETSQTPERTAEVQRGHNTTVRLTFVRHSQKNSPEVTNSEGTALSSSLLSEKGKTRARTFGQQHLSGKNVRKAYATRFDRTRETLEEALHAAGSEATILQEDRLTARSYFALPEAKRSRAYLRQYEAEIRAALQEYLATHHPGKPLEQLTDDEQETAMERANESAVEHYLAFDTQRPDPDTPSPRELASEVAAKIQRLILLPDSMPDGRSVDLVSAGHKTSTESFLKYVITRPIGSEKTVTGFKSLQEIGGSLKILDSWELLVHNDARGNKTLSLTLNRESGARQQFGIDTAALQALATESNEMKKELK